MKNMVIESLNICKRTLRQICIDLEEFHPNLTPELRDAAITCRAVAEILKKEGANNEI
jgi:hypothetical protein